MRRRQFVAVALAAAAAGCTGGDGTATEPGDGGTPTATATGTATPGGTATAAVEGEAAARLADARDRLGAAADELDVEPPGSLGGVAGAYEFDATAVEESLAAAREALDAAADAGADGAAVEARRGYADALESAATCWVAVVTLAAKHAAGVEAAGAGRREDAVAAFEAAVAARTEASAALSDARAGLDAAAGVEALSTGRLRADLDATGPVAAARDALAAGRLGVQRGRLAISDGLTSFRDEEYETAVEVFGTAIGHLKSGRDALDGGRDAVSDLGGSVERPLCRAESYLDAAYTLQEGALEMVDGNASRGFELFEKGRDAVRDTDRSC